MYIDMVETLLGLIRADRVGDWMLHLVFRNGQGELCSISTSVLCTDDATPRNMPRVVQAFQSRLLLRTAYTRESICQNRKQPTKIRKQLEEHDVLVFDKGLCHDII